MIGVERRPDGRWWWTGTIAAVVALWTWSLIARPPHFDIPDGRVLAWAGFLVAHDDVSLFENVGVIAFVVAYAAGILHVIGALVYRASGVTPWFSSVLVALGAMVMVPAGTAYAVGMLDFRDAHLTWWLPTLLGSAVVLAIAGVMSWRIARRDRQRLQLQAVLLGARQRELDAMRPPVGRA
jgi:hypothetical protein